MQPATPLKAWFFSPSLSPDGQKIAYTTLGMEPRAWIYDLRRETATRLTGDGKPWSIIWTPDGKRVVFDWGQFDNHRLIYWQPADGSSPMERLPTSDTNQGVGSFSPDGATLAFEGPLHEANWHIYLLDMRRRLETPLVSPSQDSAATYDGDPRFSPDGRWLAYWSNESGRREVYLRPFPGPGGKWQISSEGGLSPLWARNGKQLFYRREDASGQQVWAVDVQGGPAFNPGKPRLLFNLHKVRAEGGEQHGCWDISLDGRRFLMVKLEERESRPLTEMILVQNWFDELRRLAPAGEK